MGHGTNESLEYDHNPMYVYNADIIHLQLLFIIKQQPLVGLLLIKIT